MGVASTRTDIRRVLRPPRGVNPGAGPPTATQRLMRRLGEVGRTGPRFGPRLQTIRTKWTDWLGSLQDARRVVRAFELTSVSGERFRLQRTHPRSLQRRARGKLSADSKERDLEFHDHNPLGGDELGAWHIR